uniref:ATP synthase F0 subunit 8 n=1 Tax=Psychomyia kalais TaxID=2904897 RepID=A0A9E8RUY4_9NEOP|nr:ATP synthase F0 subunit 8 [Psychomyia kalais]UZZ44341.1 ATP synthase F0 subunit 8 [Psychomyia kalais]
MPQMNPMNWIMLFLYFLMIIKIMNNNIYFLMFKNKNYNKINFMNKTFKMKW